MPVAPIGDAIVIAHQVLELQGFLHDAREISSELALWLDAQLMQQKNQSRLIGTHSHTSHQQQQLSNNPGTTPTVDFLAQSTNMRLLTERSIMAAARGYSPPWAEYTNGILTPTGLEQARFAHTIIEVINAHTDNSGYKPQEWHKAEQLFIKATIPVRVLKLVKMFYHAISYTEHQYQEALRTKGSTDKFHIPGVNSYQPLSYRSASNEEKEALLTRPTFKLISPRDVTYATTEPKQDIPADVPALFEDPNSHLWTAWVPVSIFTPATRSDMKYLYRYGLVDQQAYHAGTKGRPRMVVRPSSVAIRLLKDLERLNLV